MGRTHIRKCAVNKYGLYQIHLNEMPNPNVVFFFLDNINQVYEQIIPKSLVLITKIIHLYVTIRTLSKTSFHQSRSTYAYFEKKKIMIQKNHYQINSGKKKNKKIKDGFVRNSLDELQDFLLERIDPYAWLDYPDTKRNGNDAGYFQIYQV
ncbi:hypothetical protein RFI_28385 [Reticulomyxa filosa]|uniref:Uncharacterized protein n=1 Tax=Reticulomyxa filosa TaxID=46433 RepID=X6M6B4_RETFI|nr:hypothetical protein RFI_28385 [Reticulomyxa filosa]|eukprot:ETO09002.1 hypothetical protein RFI_28385 [Reticulomyxa filosa]